LPIVEPPRTLVAHDRSASRSDAAHCAEEHGVNRRDNRYNNDLQFLQSKVLLLYNELRDVQRLENERHILAAIRAIANDAERIARHLKQMEYVARDESNGLGA
jgi:hypothetical protein